MPDPFSPNLSWLVAVFLLSLRLAAMFLMTPLLAPSLPVRARVLLVLGLAAALCSGLPGTEIAQDVTASFGSLLLCALRELVLGAMLALAVHIAFAAFSVAGAILDVQIGFGMSQVLDPATNRQSSALTAVFNQVGILVFFLLNGHHALLRGVVYSLRHFPLGAPWPLTMTFTPLFRQAAGLFTLAVALAAPVMLCIMLVELAVGVIGRNLPQMNMFTIGIPAKLVVGLVALALWATGMGNAMSQVYGSIYRTWDEIFSEGVLAAPPPEKKGRANGRG